MLVSVVGGLVGINFKGRLIFKRWSSLCVACLVALFFGVLTIGIGVASVPFGAFTLEQAAALFLIFLFTPAVIWFFFSLCIFAGVEVRDDRVVVRNFLKEAEVSLGAVEAVDWRGGVSLRLAKGKRVTCIAFPNSLYSFLIGYRNFRRVARSIERVVMEKRVEAADPGEVWGFERSRWNARSFFVIMASYVLVFLLGHVIFGYIIIF